MKNLKYDADKRLLRGTIEWPLTYFGTKTWEYELKFDLEFQNLIDGFIDQYDDDGDLYDCYPLCDPDLPNQNFNLMNDERNSIYSKNNDCKINKSFELNNDYFGNQLHSDANLEVVENMESISCRSMKYGFKISNLDGTQTMQNFEIDKSIISKFLPVIIFFKISLIENN